jgi:hypothetical protein
MVFRAVPDDSLVDDDPQIRTADRDVIVHISVTGRHIFENRFKLEEERVYALRNSYSVARDFLGKLLAKEPSRRLGGGDDDWKEIQAHEFFRGLDWGKVERKEIDPGWRPTLEGETDTSNFRDAEEAQLQEATGGQNVNVPGFTFVPDQ